MPAGMLRVSLVVAVGLGWCWPVLAADLLDANHIRRARNSITSNELRNHVGTLADDTFEGREAGSRGGRAAAGYLAKQLQDLGIRGGGEDGGYYQSFGSCRNVLGIIPGRDELLRREVVVVGAHYDHVGYGNGRTSLGPIGYIHNGADDNASGVSGVLELADALTQLASSPRRTILLAFWDGEEQGLWGSQHFVSQPTVPLANIAAAINIDMIGRLRNTTVEIFGVRTATGFRELIGRQNAETGLGCDFNWELKSNSDHYSFYSRRIPTLMLHTGLHDDYHRPSDDPEKLNTDGMEQITKLLFNLVLELAESDARPVFRNQALNETPSDSKRLEETLPPLPARLGVHWNKFEGGVHVTGVTPGGAAERAGLRTGDLLTEFAGVSLEGEAQFRRLAAVSESPVEVTFRRGETEHRVSVALDGKPARIGVSWRDDPAEPGSALIVRVVPGSPADAAGLKARDRILEVNARPVAGEDSLRQLLASEPAPLQLLVERRGQLQQLTIELSEASHLTATTGGQ